MMMRKSIHYFLYRVAGLDDLPPDVGALIRSQTDEAAIESLFFIPSQDYTVTPTGWRLNVPFLWRRTPARTLAFTPTHIIVVEAEDSQRLTVISIPLASLVSINLTVVLLYAFFELTWLEGHGVQTLRVEFNAVGEHIVREALARVRAHIAPPAGLWPDPKAWAGLAEAPVKFRNYLRYHLLPGEPVALTVYQPAVRRGEGWFQPTLGPNRALGLTDRELLLLEDPRERLTNRYGLAARFYPLRHLVRVACQPAPEAVWLRLAFGNDLAAAEVQLPLAEAAAARVNQALSAVHAKWSGQSRLARL